MGTELLAITLEKALRFYALPPPAHLSPAPLPADANQKAKK